MIVVDVETTGLDPQKHSIVSIGAVDFYAPSYQFYTECIIYPGAEISERALEINGFTEEQLYDPTKPNLEQAINEFIEWTEKAVDKTFAGENPAFDRDFLTASFLRYKPGPEGRSEWYKQFTHRTVDLHSLCYSHLLRSGKVPPSKSGRSDLSTDKILNYVGLPEEPRPHNALTGAKMEAEAFSRIIHRKTLLDEFEKHPIPDHILRIDKRHGL